MTCDMHTHTICSFDGMYRVGDMCRAAHEAGISALAITDHCDFRDSSQGWHMFVKGEQRRAEDIKAARLNYPQLETLTGVELGNPGYYPDEARAFLAERRFDFVLGSAHFVQNQLDIYYFRPRTQDEIDELFMSYFDELEAVIRFSDFDSLAHIDYPARCVRKDAGEISLLRYAERVDDVLRMLAIEGKALEINTKTYTGPAGRVSPEKWVLERFKAHGGTRITIGSDAHTPDRVGLGFCEAASLAKSCGFTHFTIYRERRPVMCDFT